MSEFEYGGVCYLCDEVIDNEDACTCVECGTVFCWGNCGGWGPNGHRCNDCGGDVDE